MADDIESPTNVHVMDQGRRPTYPKMGGCRGFYQWDSSPDWRVAFSPFCESFIKIISMMQIHHNRQPEKQSGMQTTATPRLRSSRGILFQRLGWPWGIWRLQGWIFLFDKIVKIEIRIGSPRVEYFRSVKCPKLKLNWNPQGWCTQWLRSRYQYWKSFAHLLESLILSSDHRWKSKDWKTKQRN